ncbi:MAG: hypothetical protein LBU28_04595 [Spirochaetaceae bacterium]|nr:hypothetical protein [Spirochaetaceae bacterium]
MKKNKWFIPGMLVCFLAFGLLLSGCKDPTKDLGDEDPPLTGTVSITGFAKVGGELTANTNALGGSGSISYQWQISGSADGTYADILDANRSTYTAAEADKGKYLKVRGTRAGYTGSATSAATAAVADANTQDPGNGKETPGPVNVSWTAVEDTTFGDDLITNIAYGSGRFVVVGYSDDDRTRSAYSTDGVTWTAGGDTTFGNDISGIAYGGGKFVVVGGGIYTTCGKAAYSTDGVTWTAVEDTTFGDGSAISHIAYGGDRFVAVVVYKSSDDDRPSKSAYSTDGVTWTAGSDITFNGIRGIAYGGGKFVAVGTGTIPGAGTDAIYGRVAHSTDGVTWTAGGAPFGYDLDAIAYGGGKFVAVTAVSSVYSTDGVIWAAGENTRDSPFAIFYGGGKFVTTGGNGKIAYSNAQE